MTTGDPTPRPLSVPWTVPGITEKPVGVPTLALRPRQAAKALGISLRKLSDLARAGTIPHIKVGTCTLYPVTLLEAWLTNQAKEAK
jgi:excisionase family DNA binding protein